MFLSSWRLVMRPDKHFWYTAISYAFLRNGQKFLTNMYTFLKNTSVFWELISFYERWLLVLKIYSKVSVFQDCVCISHNFYLLCWLLKIKPNAIFLKYYSDKMTWKNTNNKCFLCVCDSDKCNVSFPIQNRKLLLFYTYIQKQPLRCILES